MTTRLAASVLAFSFLATAATAQLVGPGLSWTGSSGGNATSFVPSCTNLRVAAVRGETVSLKVWGDRMASYALLAAGGANQCLPFPGLGNALVLDPPLVTIGVGVLTQISPCLSCPPGYEELRFVLPLVIPPGTAVSFQAVSFGGGRPAFTVAITASF